MQCGTHFVQKQVKLFLMERKLCAAVNVSSQGESSRSCTSTFVLFIESTTAHYHVILRLNLTCSFPVIGDFIQKIRK